ncbi:MAG: hypothetical protein Q4D29_12995 [Lachnospiraceae bacterium]|nr:hypothetical protein [Lachnospiraceae bacterium]
MEYYYEAHIRKLKEVISTWSKDDLIDLIIMKADSDYGFYRHIALMIKNATTDSVLIHKWNEIQENLISLSYDRYIDDQQEIANIWEICEDIIQFLDENEAEQNEMKDILQDIIEHDYYADVSCDEPMGELAECLSEKLN